MKEKNAHIISISSRFLGPIGKIVAWITYIFIGYASMIAYIAGGTLVVTEGISALFGLALNPWVAGLLFTLLFGVILELKTNVLGRINTLLVFAMIAAYIALVLFGVFEIKRELLSHCAWEEGCAAIPLVLTVFSFQCIIPSLTIYLDRNVKALRASILIGTAITFVVYFLWELIVLGSVPLYGAFSLQSAWEQGVAATECYCAATASPAVAIAAMIFSFFALATSFLGLGLGLMDFLADGLKIKNRGKNRWLLAALISVPSLIFALNFERIFLVALDISGGFGDSVLNGILPILMVYIGRYWMKLKGEYTVFGGKTMLALLAVLYLFVLILQITKL
jgi:tyrosine-specific transport protein